MLHEPVDMGYGLQNRLSGFDSHMEFQVLNWVKCYGSTRDSKPLGGGSTPSTRANGDINVMVSILDCESGSTSSNLVYHPKY